MDGNTIIPIISGIYMTRFEYRTEMEKALAQWEEHKKHFQLLPKMKFIVLHTGYIGTVG